MKLEKLPVPMSSTLSFSFSLMSGGRRQTFDRRLSCEPGVWPPGHPHHVEEKRMDFLFGLLVLTTPFLAQYSLFTSHVIHLSFCLKSERHIRKSRCVFNLLPS